MDKLFFNTPGANGCLQVEKHCGVCDFDKLFDSAHKIKVHGRQGHQKGCACPVCRSWYEKERALVRLRVLKSSRRNQNNIKALRRNHAL